MSERTDLVARLATWVGSSLVVDELGTGWPSLATLTIDGESVPLALFVSTVTRSHRNRDAVERRFQNPSNIPLVSVSGRESVLIGVWDKDDVEEVGRPVVAMAEARRRDDGRTTRWSVFLQLAALLEAEATGWASDVTDSGETIRYLHPVMLPVAITASMNRTEPNEKSIYRSISTLGLLDPATDLTELPEIERVRRTVTSLVRDSKFSGAVLDAYARRCAMCGLGLGLVQGAHIYPASAPGSRDETSNGLALCANHHLAFDRYLIAIRPDTMEVIFNPSVLELAESDEAVSTFVRNTVYRLRVADAGHGPDPHAFDRRHDYFKEQYAWANLYRD